MPKVLRIINRFNLGGPTYNVAYLTKYMAPEFETLLIGGEKEDTEDSSKFIINEIGLHTFLIKEMKRSINFRNDNIAYNKIKNIIKRYQPDIVHTHASKAGTLGRMAANACNVPVVVHTFHGHVFHSYFNKVKTSLFKQIERNLSGKTDKIIAISEKQKIELVNIYKICPEEKVAVIPLGFDLNRFAKNQEEKRKAFRERYSIDKDTIAIGIVGRLVPIKNHTLFIKSIDYILKNTQKKISAFIIGDGEEREKIEKQIQVLNIPYKTPEKRNNAPIITFTSWLKNIDEVNAGMDIIALTSLNEGTPVSLIEAQAANRAVVSTNVGGVSNIVKHGETGFLSEINNEYDFMNNLLSLVQNDVLRKTMGQNSRKNVIEKYHYKRLVKDMKQLYYELLQTH